MIPVVTLPIPDVEVSFLPFTKVRRSFFGTESKSDLTLVQVRSSKNFISFASPSAKADFKSAISLSKTTITH